MCFSLILNTIHCLLLKEQKCPLALPILFQLENNFCFHFHITTFLRFNLLPHNCPTFKNRMAFSPRTYHKGVLASRRCLFNHYFGLLQLQQENYRKICLKNETMENVRTAKDWFSKENRKF